MRNKLFLIFILLVSYTFASYCPNREAIIHVPAVVEDSRGGVLQIGIKITDGSGKIYTNIDPVIGISTQLSQRDAIMYGFEDTGIEQKYCNVYVNIYDNRTTSVDGPSAGLAMAVATRAVLENKTIRKDIAITGTIMPKGMVGAVGGVIDKAQASAREGIQILITPKQAIYENILLSKLSEDSDFITIEATKFREAYEIATSPMNRNYQPNFKLEKKNIPEKLPKRKLDSDDIHFSNVAHAINSDLNKIVEEDFNGLDKYKNYFEYEVEQNIKTIDMGYAYTAANNAFLSQVDAAFLSTPPDKIDLKREIKKTEECISSLQDVELNDENYEWVAGADARKYWAEQKLRDINSSIEQFSTQETKYMALREIYFARSWCEAAKYLQIEAKQKRGKPTEQNILKTVAEKRLKDVQKLIDGSLIPDYEAIWHLNTANKSFSDGNYLATLFDCAYAIGMQRATIKKTQEGDDAIKLPTYQLIDDNYTTLWARTYQSQGIYIFYSAKEKGEPETNSYSVLKLAESMEVMMQDIKNRIEHPPESFTINVEKKNEQKIVEMIVWVIIIMINLTLIIQILKIFRVDKK